MKSVLKLWCVVIASVVCSLALGNSAYAQRATGLQPSESVWTPAPTPEGGVSWQTLEETTEIQRMQAGFIYSKPEFTDDVKALAGKTIKVNGYIMPLQNSAKQTHFVLLAYPPDCPFHLNPAPTQFIEVFSSVPVGVDDDVLTIEGVLELTGEDESGIFYRMIDSKQLETPVS